ncbi:MAG TPA: YaaC family protein [Hyphomicrobiaceae bacterium]|nr:YaaC family protein [Hyphomicrobiaceae bacterium]
MPAPELRIGNRTAYLRKAIRTPDFQSESVLTRDAFQFAELWLRRNCREALPFWRQAANYYSASRNLPAVSAPLTSYYCFLNATKALLTVKGVAFSERHGVSGEFNPAAKRVLSNEVVKIQSAGIMTALSSYMEEPETQNEHALTDLLANLPFIHRSYRHTFKSQKELFIPVRNVVYRKHPTDDYVWFTAEIVGRFADKRSLRTLPPRFEVDAGYDDRCVIRTKKRIKWFRRGTPKASKAQALARLNTLHRSVRLDLSFISAPLDLWYLRREVSGNSIIRRYGMTMIMAIMHRLSELSRYDPKGLSGHLDGQANWLLTEFIQLAPAQFIDEIICEMTSLEFRLPGVRP